MDPLLEHNDKFDNETLRVRILDPRYFVNAMSVDVLAFTVPVCFHCNWWGVNKRDKLKERKLWFIDDNNFCLR